MTVDVDVAAMEDEPEDRRIYGVVTGEVINLLDPMGLSRVQVRFKSLDAMDLTAYARVATPMAGILHGTYFIPSVGDEVLLAFENGDPDVPYIVGSLHNVRSLPAQPSPLPQFRQIRTPLGNQIVMGEAGQMIAIQTSPTSPGPPLPPSPAGPHHTIMLSSAGIQITSPTGVQILSTANIVLQVGPSQIAITPAGVFITAPRVATIGTGDVRIMSPLVGINS